MDCPADVICWHAGVQDKRVVHRQAIGIAAGSYAVAGWTGVLIVPFLLFSTYLFAQRLWSGTSSANIFAIFFVMDNQNKLVEWDPSSIIGAIFRGVVLEMLAFVGLIFLTRFILIFITASRSSPRVRPQPAFEATPRT
jgi:hypothetical protein